MLPVAKQQENLTYTKCRVNAYNVAILRLPLEVGLASLLLEDFLEVTLAFEFQRSVFSLFGVKYEEAYL